jgi:hypothetical protein
LVDTQLHQLLYLAVHYIATALTTVHPI